MSRPAFWYTVVMLAALFAAALYWRAPGTSLGDVVAWIVAVGVLAGALMKWAKE